MKYIQFYDPKRTPMFDKEEGKYTGAYIVSKTEYQEATGDRSVIILDGREKRQTHLEIANAEMLKRGYKAFQLFEGESFTRSHEISTLYTE